MADTMQNRRPKLGCGGAAAIGFLGLLALMAFGSQEEKKEQTARFAEARGDTSLVATITADELAAAFDANEIAATQTYGAGRRKITGTVDSVIAGFDGDPILVFKTKSSYGAQAGLEADDANAVAALREGQTVAVMCDKVVATMARASMADCALTR